MKTESAQFGLDRLKRAGMQPVYLWRFIFSSLNLSTISLTAGASATAYSPYVLSFNSIDFSLEQGNNFGAVASTSIVLARNSTTNALFTDVQSGTAVEVDMGFYKGVNIPQADLMPMARFVFAGISEVTQAQFTVNLANDERKLKPILSNQLQDVVIVPEQNKAVFIPLALGTFNAPSGSVNDLMFEAKGHDYLPSILANEVYNAAHTYNGIPRVDIGELVVAQNRVGTTTTPTTQRVFEYISALDTHVLINGTNQTDPPTYFNTWEYTNSSGDTFLPSGITAGKIRVTKDRILTRLIETDIPGNTVNDSATGSNFTWKHLADDNFGNVTRVQAGQTPARNILIVGWSRKYSQPQRPSEGYITFIVTAADKTLGGGTRIKLKLGRVDTGVLDVAFSVFDIVAATTLPIFFDSYFSSPSISIADTTFGDVAWNWDNIFIQITVEGVSTTSTQFAEFATMGVELVYADENFAFKRATATKIVRGSALRANYDSPKDLSGSPIYLPQIDFRPNRDYLVPTKYEFVASGFKVVFADYNSATNINTATLGWGDSFSAPWMLYAVLGDVLGYTAAQIDGDRFVHTADNWSTLRLGVYIDQDRPAVEILRLIAFQGNVLLFYGGEGKWKLKPKWKYLAGTGSDDPVTQFADTAQDYTISDLRWHILEPAYNKFTLLYQFDYARGKYSGRATSDQTSAVPNGKPYDDIEGLFIRASTTASTWLTNFVTYHTKRRRVLDFETSLVATHLELGDFIKASHSNLPDNTPRYQIIQITYGATAVRITAVEI